MAFLIESVVLCLLFTVPLAVMSKNPLAGIHNYPPAIIRRVRELGLVEDTQLPGSRAVYCKKIAAALVVAVLCTLVVWFANGARNFWQGFGIMYLLWTVVNCYDALVIDCIWFCHDKRFRIPGTEDMEADYLDYWFHIKASLKGQLTGLPVALLVGFFTALLAAIE